VAGVALMALGWLWWCVALTLGVLWWCAWFPVDAAAVCVRGIRKHQPPFCVAGVAFGNIAFTLFGSRGTHGTGLARAVGFPCPAFPIPSSTFLCYLVEDVDM